MKKDIYGRTKAESCKNCGGSEYPHFCPKRIEHTDCNGDTCKICNTTPMSKEKKESYQERQIRAFAEIVEEDIANDASRVSKGQSTPSPTKEDWEEVARLFHDTYETLAPAYGYETREETREFDLESRNGKLMIAVCEHVCSFLLTQRERKVLEEIREMVMELPEKTEEDLRWLKTRVVYVIEHYNALTPLSDH